VVGSPAWPSSRKIDLAQNWPRCTRRHEARVKITPEALPGITASGHIRPPVARIRLYLLPGRALASSGNLPTVANESGQQQAMMGGWATGLGHEASGCVCPGNWKRLFTGTLPGATGLEPATSGVTARFARLRAGVPEEPAREVRGAAPIPLLEPQPVSLSENPRYTPCEIFNVLVPLPGAARA
jgi:hypothetical protein